MLIKLWFYQTISVKFLVEFEAACAKMTLDFADAANHIVAVRHCLLLLHVAWPPPGAFPP
jgi:hypothetical protein